MDKVHELVTRTQYLLLHVETLRKELEQLRKDLSQLRPKENGSSAGAGSCFSVAANLAEDLGSAFSAEDPGRLPARGDEWFGEP